MKTKKPKKDQKNDTKSNRYNEARQTKSGKRARKITTKTRSVTRKSKNLGSRRTNKPAKNTAKKVRKPARKNKQKSNKQPVLKYSFINKKGKKVIKTMKQIKKSLKWNEKPVFSTFDKIVRIKRTYKEAIRSSLDYSLLPNQDQQTFVEELKPYIYKLIERIEYPHELYNFRVQYGSRDKELKEFNDFISTINDDFGEYDIENMDKDEIYSIFMKRKIEELANDFISKISKYIERVFHNEVQLINIELNIYNNLVQE